MARFSDFALPFFARPATKRVIQEVSAFRELYVYAGAGVTVESTGLKWNELLTQLFISGGVPKKEAAAVLEVVWWHACRRVPGRATAGLTIGRGTPKGAPGC